MPSASIRIDNSIAPLFESLLQTVHDDHEDMDLIVTRKSDQAESVEFEVSTGSTMQDVSDKYFYESLEYLALGMEFTYKHLKNAQVVSSRDEDRFADITESLVGD